MSIESTTTVLLADMSQIGNVEKYFNFQAFKHLFPFKDAFLNNIGIYYLWQFRPETFSLGCASLHEDYYMQCPVFWQSQVSHKLTNKVYYVKDCFLYIVYKYNELQQV